MALKDYIFTSESVSEGHPDKVCDQISDAILDAFIANDVKLGIADDTIELAHVLLARFDHASLGLFGRERPAVLLRAASAAPVEEALLNDIDAMLALDPGKCLSYADARRGISKRVMIEAGQVAGVRLTGETAARDWLKEAITDGLPADAVRRWVLAPVASLPQSGSARGRIVCACENVGERVMAVDADRALPGADLGEALRAMGFNRASFGIQDFDPEVQRAINRVQSEEATRAVVDGTRNAMTKPTRIVPMTTLRVSVPTRARMLRAIRLSRPVDVIAAARNSAEATSTSAVFAKPLNARVRAALVPISTFGLAGLGEKPSRNAISAAMTIAETA